MTSFFHYFHGNHSLHSKTDHSKFNCNSFNLDQAPLIPLRHLYGLVEDLAIMSGWGFLGRKVYIQVRYSALLERCSRWDRYYDSR